jgi:hypothetical protein
MAFNGYLSKFSLPELFQFLEEGYKTGLLTVSSCSHEVQQVTENYYIWFQQGNIIAAANSLDNRCLVSAIVKRGWIDMETISKLFKIPNNNTLGLCLKSQRILQAEQLSLLFRNQISSHVSPLFELLDAQFEFNFQAQLPKAEMTGLSMSATEATVAALRVLRDWNSLEKKLPEISSRLKRTITGEPKFRLEHLESQLLEYANGQESLQDIAAKLYISQEKIRQVTFRLIVSNLAEEIFGVYSTIKEVEIETFEQINKTLESEVSTFPDIPEENLFSSKSNNDNVMLIEKKPPQSSINSASIKPPLSKSFLESLTEFLKTQVTE